MRRTVLAVSLLCLLALAPTANASFPGRNGNIALGTQSGVRIVTPLGRTVTRLGSPTGYEPRWAPDGRRIAFAERAPTATDFGIVVGDAATGAVAPVPLPFAAVDPGWSPDGRWLLVTRVRGLKAQRRDIYRVRPDGAGLRSLIPNALEAAYAPDGKRIAYVALGADGCRRLALARADGTARTTLVDRIGRGVTCSEPPSSPDALERRGAVFMPDWRPDGGALVYASDGAAGELDLATRVTRTLARARPKPRTTFLLWPRYSPDGRRLVFSDGPYGAWSAWAIRIGSPNRTSLGEGSGTDWGRAPG